MSWHTPGPWEAVRYEDYESGITRNGVKRGRRVVLLGRLDDSEDLANTYLIAAAPSLLEALQDVLRCWKDECPHLADEDVYKSALAAIALATGKEAT